MQPFFDHIPKVKWITIDCAAHFAHVDQREKYIKHLEDLSVIPRQSRASRSHDGSPLWLRLGSG
ncbi:hypothetical protein F5Y16DRAFT_391471 [Xylariaceae sp. FL0255]|nr:hypothetical protein F5Y16DRAFT_391471 [Xylariaceae sp. FL0255]